MAFDGFHLPISISIPALVLLLRLIQAANVILTSLPRSLGSSSPSSLSVATRSCFCLSLVENSKYYDFFGYGMTNTGQDALLMTCSVMVPVTKSLMLSLPSVAMTIKSTLSF